MSGINLNSDEGAEKGVNLIYGNNAESKQSVKVSDHDDDENATIDLSSSLSEDANLVPEDLISNSKNKFSLKNFNLAQYKFWIISLIVAIGLFTVVIVSINSSNKKVQEKLNTTEDEIASTGNIPSFFTGSVLGSGSDEAPDAGATTGSTTTNTTGSTAGPVIDPEAPTTTTNQSPANEDPDIDTIDGFDISEDFDFESIFGSAEEFDDEESSDDDEENTDAETEDTDDTSLGLGSNTSPETMLAGEVQGDTGPALWLAFIPTLAYGLTRKPKK